MGKEIVCYSKIIYAFMCCNFLKGHKATINTQSVIAYLLMVFPNLDIANFCPQHIQTMEHTESLFWFLKAGLSEIN